MKSYQKSYQKIMQKISNSEFRFKKWSGRRDSNPRHPAWKIGSHNSTWSVIAHYCSVKRLSVVRHCLILFDIAKYELLPKKTTKIKMGYHQASPIPNGSPHFVRKSKKLSIINIEMFKSSRWHKKSQQLNIRQLIRRYSQLAFTTTAT